MTHAVVSASWAFCSGFDLWIVNLNLMDLLDWKKEERAADALMCHLFSCRDMNQAASSELKEVQRRFALKREQKRVLKLIFIIFTTDEVIIQTCSYFVLPYLNKELFSEENKVQNTFWRFIPFIQPSSDWNFIPKTTSCTWSMCPAGCMSAHWQQRGVTSTE